jgi:hypothetical protein
LAGTLLQWNTDLALLQTIGLQASCKFLQCSLLKNFLLFFEIEIAEYLSVEAIFAKWIGIPFRFVLITGYVLRLFPNPLFSYLQTFS